MLESLINWFTNGLGKINGFGHKINKIPRHKINLGTNDPHHVAVLRTPKYQCILAFTFDLLHKLTADSSIDFHASGAPYGNHLKELTTFEAFL
ncbi:hypothetical protein DICVIV_08203 [Dictyocaulus viviparus]|uniref:Uncharacterized protein n=1 Tax=Dictyocaulus viviparus TaxID=29172 RepID=A0A0D8XPV4_DICVI|nr:hypothetical protein DICVIV_08203 [Dictyocaulus viviparus]